MLLCRRLFLPAQLLAQIAIGALLISASQYQIIIEIQGAVRSYCRFLVTK